MLPQFSLRVILLLTTAAAALSAVLARAAQGDAWAIGVSAAFAWAALAFLFHAVFYSAASVLGGFAPGARSEPAADQQSDQQTEGRLD